MQRRLGAFSLRGLVQPLRGLVQQMLDGEVFRGKVSEGGQPLDLVALPVHSAEELQRCVKMLDMAKF